MKNINKGLCFGLVLMSFDLEAQSQLTEILSSVEQNNKTLVAYKSMLMADSTALLTGLTLDNPSISADYMIGRPASGGNQFDLLVVQSLDFPTVYGKRKQLAQNKAVQLGSRYETNRQAILLECQLLYIKAVDLNRRKSIAKERLERAKDIQARYQTLFNQEQITAIDLNKSKIKTLDLRATYESIVGEMTLVNDQLTGLNGGVDISVSDNSWNQQLLPSFETVYDSILNNDPQKEWYDQQILIDQAKIQLTRAEVLPKLEGGYHYQSVLGQTFNGVHIGLTIPLWEHKNKVKAAEVNELATMDLLESRKSELWSATKASYNKLQSLQVIISEYESVITASQNLDILDKSLELGEIDFITYANELTYFYSAQDELMIKQLEYQLELAQLLKYQL